MGGGCHQRRCSDWSSHGQTAGARLKHLGLKASTHVPGGVELDGVSWSVGRTFALDSPGSDGCKDQQRIVHSYPAHGTGCGNGQPLSCSAGNRVISGENGDQCEGFCRA